MNKSVVAIYCRLSKEDDRSGDSESIQNQKSMLISYSIHNNWDIFNIYSDDDYSGTDNTRPGWNEMLREAQNGKFNIILCKTQSRFSRDMAVIEEYLHGKFIEWGIRFVSIIDNADTSLRGNKKARQINSLINEWYLEDLSENVRAVFKDKMMRGEYLSTYAPYGYQKDPDKRNHLITDEQPAKVVRMIYNWYFEGYGTQKIACKLNELDIPNPRKQKEIDGIRKTKMYEENEQGLWCATTVSDILHNQTYCGDTVQNMYCKISYKSERRIKVPKDNWIIVQHTHDPIINRDVFAQVQHMLAQKRRATGTGEVHMLAGKVVCHFCGKVMRRNHSISSNIGRIGYLRCRNKYLLALDKKCLTPNVRVDYIEDAVRQELKIWLDKYIVHKGMHYNAVEIPVKFRDEKKQLQLQIAKIDTALKSLYMDKASKIIADEQFHDLNESFLTDKQCLQKKLLKIFNETRYTGNKKNDAVELKTFIESDEFIRSAVRELIDYIDVGRIDKGGKEMFIDVNWNF